MPSIILYMLKMSVALTVFYVFYQCFLRKLTFYNLNRVYLLGYSFIALLVPIIDISLFVEHDNGNAAQIINIIPQFYAGDEADQLSGSSAAHWNSWNWIQFIIVTGMVGLFIQLIIRLVSFLILRKKSQRIHASKLSIYQVNEEIIPFSFGRSIFVNSSLHDENELEEIIRHEFVHVKQGHTADIIWSELLCIFNWYNPAAWLFRRAIRQNLEFIADNKVLQQGIDRKQYQYLLLKVIGNKHFSIANKFNFSSLKKRIAMMNKMKTAKVHVLRFLFIIPLLAIVLLAFRTNSQTTDLTASEVNRSNYVMTGSDTVPVMTEVRKFANSKGYFLEVIDQNGTSIVQIKDKNGIEIEKVDLREWEANKKYTEKYGDIASAKSKHIERRSDRSGADLEINGSKARITLKNGKKEEYDLSNTSQRKVFEEKYGKIIELPADRSGSTVYQVDESGTIIGVGIGQGKGSGSGEGSGAGAGSGSGQGNATGSGAGSGKGETIPRLAEVAVIGHPGTAQNGISVIAATTEPITVMGYPKMADEFVEPVTMIGTRKGANVVSTTNAVSVVNADGEVTTADGRPIFNSEDAIIITISKKNTKADLEKHTQDMKSKGIDLTFENIEFNDAGELTSLTGKLKYNDSSGNFVAKDFSKVRIYIVKDQGKIHFRISTDEKIVS